MFERIDLPTFVGVSYLTMLDLSGNRTQELNEHIFRGLVNLTHKSLANYQINQIHPYEFTGLKTLLNTIRIVKDRTFTNFTKLNRLQMSFNSINEIESLDHGNATTQFAHGTRLKF